MAPIHLLKPMFPLRLYTYVAKLAQHFEKLAQQILWKMCCIFLISWANFQPWSYKFGLRTRNQILWNFVELAQAWNLLLFSGAENLTFSTYWFSWSRSLSCIYFFCFQCIYRNEPAYNLIHDFIVQQKKKEKKRGGEGKIK